MISKISIDNLTINHRASILEAMVKLNNILFVGSISKLILFVTDESSKVVGTLTDGDIRRSIINSKSLEGQILDLCNRGFTYLKDTNSFIELEQYRKRGIKILPILSDSGQLVKVIDLEKIATEPLVISYHEENEEIFILDSKFNQIFVVSSESDSRHHSKDKHPKILRELSFENSSSKRLVSFAIHKEYILLGDKLSNSIYIVDSKCSGKCSIIDSFSDDIFKSCDLKSIQYMDEEFVLTNECQEQNFFKLD